MCENASSELDRCFGLSGMCWLRGHCMKSACGLAGIGWLGGKLARIVCRGILRPVKSACDTITCVTFKQGESKWIQRDQIQACDASELHTRHSVTGFHSLSLQL